MGGHRHAWLHHTFGQTDLDIISRRCQAVVTRQRQGAASCQQTSQCQRDPGKTSTMPEAERFSEKAAAKGANITSSLQPL